MKQILHMLGIALIEIRASEDLYTTQCIADIFHNVPSQIMNGQSADEIYNSIKIRAENIGMKKYIETLKNVSDKFVENLN